MPVTVVAGGQYGSEGKGKTALHWHARAGAQAAVRVGGANSGHTVVGPDGTLHVLRHLPVAVIDPQAELFLPPGNYIDAEVLLEELHRYEVDPSRVSIDPDASVIDGEDRARERASGLTARIGSTASGTGVAVQRRVARDPSARRARDVPDLAPYLHRTGPRLRALLDAGGRAVIEGTQGFGLSLLHGGHGPFATSRDTTAAGFLAEAGLSPLDVDEVVVVLRALPIRVAGRSGPLPEELTWEVVAAQSGQRGLRELTTVTRRTRRIARFDADVVRGALAANRPSSLVLNHVDYLADLSTAAGVAAAEAAVRDIEASIGRGVDLIGDGASRLVDRATWARAASAAVDLPAASHSLTVPSR